MDFLEIPGISKPRHCKVRHYPIDDSETVTLTLYANSGTDYLGNKVYLIIRCKSSEIALYIGWKSYLGSSANVLTRVGTEKAETKSWSLSTNSQATFSTEPTELINRMLNNQKFDAQVWCSGYDWLLRAQHSAVGFKTDNSEMIEKF